MYYDHKSFKMGFTSRKEYVFSEKNEKTVIEICVIRFVFDFYEVCVYPLKTKGY